MPDVGRGQEILIKDTIKAYQEAGRDGSRAEAGHPCGGFRPMSDVCGLFHVSPGKEARETFEPVYGSSDRGRSRIRRSLCKGTGQTLRGMTIFLWVQRGRGKRRAGPWHSLSRCIFINQHYRCIGKLVRIGGSGRPLADHYRAGRYIARAAENLGRSVFIVASGDLSHKLRRGRAPRVQCPGPEYDERIADVMGKAEFGERWLFPEDFCEKAGECGHRSFVMMAGAMDKKAVVPRRLHL